MKALRLGILAVVVALAGIVSGQSARNSRPSVSNREKLIGAWHLVSIGESDADGKVDHATEIKGTLIYTRDGHMSVQLMYPPSMATLTNDYVLNGYEASFGSYDVNEEAHTVTHHVQGSITRGLVGKDLTRVYRFSDGHLIIKSANPDEHWRAVWEHDQAHTSARQQTAIEQGASKMEIKRVGTQASSKGSPEWFTGTVRIDPLFQAPEPGRVSGASVTFEPGARTAWHTHPLGQTLIITAGAGWVQREGESVTEVHPGDVIWFPQDERHWHGATSTTSVTHIAIQEKIEVRNVDWMEKVTDEQYRN